MLSIGVDLIEIARIKRSCEKYGERFYRRVLTDDEARYCFQKANPYESVAVRFAAKEAFAKALGTGISAKVGWRDLEIERESSGKPVLKLNRDIEGVKPEQISLSLSHTHEYAIAMVVIAR
ncbi:MAG: holo-ACP synthase [Chloroherpetonaceae bacterium]|nr:holo-ACP synthase [Chloroherpetonaceae bacterium]MDW8438649.1 holo-ACP synthase [Chloroherpetonaceae bacterium]